MVQHCHLSVSRMNYNLMSLIVMSTNSGRNKHHQWETILVSQSVLLSQGIITLFFYSIVLHCLFFSVYRVGINRNRFYGQDMFSVFTQVLWSKPNRRHRLGVACHSR